MHQQLWGYKVEEEIQGGSDMTGTNCDLFTHNQSRSYLNHLVYLGVYERKRLNITGPVHWLATPAERSCNAAPLSVSVETLLYSSCFQSCAALRRCYVAQIGTSYLRSGTTYRSHFHKSSRPRRMARGTALEDGKVRCVTSQKSEHFIVL
jgi:hypothetical protein